MSQAAITLAFEKFKAQEAAGGRTLILDEFVLANVPGLDPSAPIDRNEGMPPAGQIVHRQAVNTTGVVNEHAVAYSITMGTEIGDFDFNWLGLVNKATGLLAMVVHVPTQRKIANAAGQQGNALTRSFLMEFDGAAAATGITTPAETWQIDFTARLHGMDEMQRLANRDLYGAGAFFGDGFLVVRQGAGYTATAGIGYIGGLRAELTGNKPLSIGSKPTKVWADVSLQGNVTSVWETVVALTVAETMVDYVDQGGFAHYVFAVAGIDAAGTVTDLRPKGSTTDQASQEATQKLRDDLDKHVRSRNHPDATLADKGFVRLYSGVDSSDETKAATPKAVKIAMDNANARLAKERNLADLTNIALARQNLQLGNSATRNFGTTANTVAAGDDSRITGAMQKGQHGADIPDKGTFLKNINVYSKGEVDRKHGMVFYTLNAPTGAVSGKYYPVIIRRKSGADEVLASRVVISTKGDSNPYPMNKCEFNGFAMAGGWSDRGTYAAGLFYAHDVNERAIKSILSSSNDDIYSFVFYVEARAFPVSIFIEEGLYVLVPDDDKKIGQTIYKWGALDPFSESTNVVQVLDFNKGRGFYCSRDFIGRLAGNAQTASKLENVRKIAGVDFDGSKDISISAANVDAFSLGQTGEIVADVNSVPWDAPSGIYDARISGASNMILHFNMGKGSCPAVQFKVNYRNGGIAYRSARDRRGFESDWEDIITTSRASFVTDVKLGAEYSKGYGASNPVKANAGSVLTGLQEYAGDNEIHTYFFKPVQILKNGSWITIAG